MSSASISDHRSRVNGNGRASGRLNLKPNWETEEPRDLEAEQAVVASLLADPSLLNDSRVKKLQQHHFFYEPERLLYGVIEEMVGVGKPTKDPTILYEELRSRRHSDGRDLLTVVGGAAYLARQIYNRAEPANYGFYADIVWEKSQQRLFMQLAREVHQASATESPLALLQRMEEGLIAVKRETSETRDGFKLLTSAELDAGNFNVEYIIPGILPARQPGIIGAPPKGMKTSITVDLGIAVATGGKFLGHFAVTKALPVLIMSAESGMGTLRATARAVAAKAGKKLSDIQNLYWCSTVPKIGDPTSMAHLERTAEKIAGGILVVDPTYLALPAEDPGNLFAQGALLRSISEMCERRGITCVMVHHLKKTQAKEFNVPELASLSWSGFGEWARWWILLNRRERYVPPSPHRLWMVVGGSAGHSGHWRLDIDQGELGSLTPSWTVTVAPAIGAPAETTNDPDARRESRKKKQLPKDMEKISAYLLAASEGDTTRGIADAADVPYRRSSKAIQELVKAGHVEACDVYKSDRARPRAGWRLTEKTDGLSSADATD